VPEPFIPGPVRAQGTARVRRATSRARKSRRYGSLMLATVNQGSSPSRPRHVRRYPNAWCPASRFGGQAWLTAVPPAGRSVFTGLRSQGPEYDLSLVTGSSTCHDR
jgi:hypothetical protein